MLPGYRRNANVRYRRRRGKTIFPGVKAMEDGLVIEPETAESMRAASQLCLSIDSSKTTVKLYDITCVLSDKKYRAIIRLRFCMMRTAGANDAKMKTCRKKKCHFRLPLKKKGYFYYD